MTYLEDGDIAEIREDVHTINNALNVVSMQAELIKVLASDSASAEQIAAAVDVILNDCQKAGRSASGISRRVKKRDD